ncbi:MAG TPA: hypothetical protein VE890_07085, partial [Thermoguttaceae bacterium]|nr:hypothetical protein [Thermoguttaceae bacterium]
PGAIDIVANYEVWDAVQESQRNNKELPSGANLAILASRAMGTTKGTILLSDVLFYPSDENVTSVSKTIQLDEMLQAGEVDWGFNLGQEFAGAKGGLDLVPDQPEAGKQAMRLHADFTAGGQYVGVRKTFEHLNVEAMRVIRIKVRTETAKSFALRLLDGSGQCHQRKGLPLTPDGQWHELVIVPEQIAGGEHWGGKNDGQWHDSVQLIELMLNIRSDENSKPDLLLTDMRADVLVAARVKPASFAETFDTQSSLPKGWGHTGDIAVDASGAATEEKSLALRRELSALQTETGATGRTFDAQPGPWQIQYAWKAKLHSPDNSYHGSVALEALGSADRVLETIPVGIGYGTQDWQQVSQSIRLPEGTRRARFRIQLNKTYGTFWVDDLSASPMTVGPTEQRVERILLASDAVGNLFFPGDPVVVRATVEARKPLREDEQQMHYSLRDYWGAEQIPPGRVTLQRVGRKGPSFVYSAEIRLPQQQLAVGKYYELNVAIEQPGGEPVREFSGLAVLPTAAAKQHKPEDIPFTIRNWDSRIGVYFDLADRIGLRMLGVWGGWSPDAPYKPHCPGSDRCRELGAKWITGTPAATVERKGFTEYSEEALRQGMKNFLAEYADSGMAMIAMGNEPHGTGDKVLENVRAYRAIYETVKAFDPKIHVIGTSVEPNEEYFKAGYQNYLDSYDFHIYEHYTNVRRTIREYRELMKKYDAVKPIHSTELGLNSQGQTRHAVALEMIKKFTVFFAEGGATVSWFTIQYPDPQGKARGQFGDSHCIFDCKYNLYNPRLDAITHYQMLNGICDKRFVEEQHYPGGAQAYLFRNGKGDCLQVVWLENHRRDVLVPLPADRTVDLVRLDGSQTRLQSDAAGITVTLSTEPVLLLYSGNNAGLAPSLGT